MAMFKTTIYESRKILGKLKNKRSISHDGRSNEKTECCLPVIEPYLVEIFKICLNGKKFLEEIKMAKVAPFFKTADKIQPEIYRAMSFLSSIRKIFESFLCKRNTILFQKWSLLGKPIWFSRKAIVHQRYLWIYRIHTRAITQKKVKDTLFPWPWKRVWYIWPQFFLHTRRIVF